MKISDPEPRIDDLWKQGQDMCHQFDLADYKTTQLRQEAIEETYA